MRKKISFLLIICILWFSSLLKAEKQDTTLVCKVIKHGLIDSKNWALSPLKWESKDWIVFGGVSAATGALIAWGDQPVYNLSNTLNTNFLEKLSPFVEPMGNTYLYASITGFFLHGILTKNNYSVETSVIATESLLLATLFVQTIKNTVYRERPNDFGTTTPHQWDGPFFKGNSFFSGHTIAAFSVCSVIAYRYRDTKWVSILSYGLASLVGLQRIYDNGHWSSDVLFGAAVGTATGIFLCKSWEKSPIRFYPSFSPEYSQLTLIIPLHN